MDLRIEPLSLDEVDNFVRTYWEAFKPLSANMIMPMIYTLGLRPDLVERSRQSLLHQTGGNPGTTCFCAKDVTSGEIVGVSRWSFEEKPPQTKEEIDAKFQQESENRQREPTVEGVNQELEQAYYRTAFFSEMETVAGQTYTILRLLAVRPNHQRRGAGSLLLRHGLEKADRLGLPVYLDSGISGKPLYERFGFKVTSEFALNCLDYGGRSDGRHWCMWRPVHG